MKKQFTMLAAALLSFAVVTQAANFSDLLPKPVKAEQVSGELVLPSGFTVAAPEAMTDEASAFVDAINATTGLGATMTSGSDAFVTITVDPDLAAEGYTLAIAADGIDITAATPAGAFYALQTVKKLLPANVMAAVAGEPSQVYSLPLGSISDQPRYEYRGFMLDVSRHFFDADQVKKMLDIMAVYKLNRFHWHLTDDQGWRLPVAKYPKLTEEGATNQNILLTNFDAQTQWRAGEGVIYGPYAYTADEVKDIVAYAKARHIEVIPEIDMPGHMVAAIHAYPEFSTDPDNERKVHEDMSHEIWNKGGVSRDVLDVSNPKAIEFIKDVVDALVEYFPYEYIHIGGDECPTLAWEKSPSCQAMKSELGLTTDRQLQSWFVQQIADYAATKGRKVMGWNELITESGVDMDMINRLDPTIFCWIGGEAKAEANGLKHVYTPFNGGYYINRSYAGIDKVGAVKDGSLAVTINNNPPANNQHCIGVQGTFWTEQVDRYTDLEYLALPRLIGIAEQGWSSEINKDFDEVVTRIQHDEEYLQLAGYNYGAHQLVLVERRTPQSGKWYNIKTVCTDDRSGKAWSVDASTKLMLGAEFNAASQAQQFQFVEDPINAGHYAIVCRAYPNGCVSSTPTNTTLGGRWNYLENTDNLDYGFILDKGYYTEDEASDLFTYAIRPENLSGLYLNFSRSGQSYYINVYDNPNDGSGGKMQFVLVEEGSETETPVICTEFTPDTYYRLNTRFNGDSSQARHGTCIELLQEGSAQIAAYSDKNAAANRLWSGKPAAKTDDNYNHQWFKFEPDPAGSGYYALVCRAKPEGSVNCTPIIANNAATGRWEYADNTKHYGFYLSTVDGHSGVDEKGFYSAFTSKDAAEGWYVNTSAAPQGFSVHLYGNPKDQNAGLYTFEIEPLVSSLSDVEAEAPATKYYDLQGRCVTNPTHGLYITTQGKKIIL